MQDEVIELWLLKRETFWNFYRGSSCNLMTHTEELRAKFFAVLFEEKTTWDALNMLAIDGFDLEKISIFRTKLGVNFGFLRRVLDTKVVADTEYKQKTLDQFVDRVANIFGTFLLRDHPFAAKWVPKESCAKRAAKHNSDSLVKYVFKAVVENFFNGSRQGFRLHVTDLNTKHGLFEQALASKWKTVSSDISIGAAKRNYKICEYDFAHARQWSYSDQQSPSMVRYKIIHGRPYWVPKPVRDELWKKRKKLTRIITSRRKTKPVPFIRDCDRFRLASKPVVMLLHGDIFTRYFLRMALFLSELGGRCYVMRATDGVVRSIDSFLPPVAETFRFSRLLWKFAASQNYRKPVRASKLPFAEPVVVLHTTKTIERYKSPKHQYVSYCIKDYMGYVSCTVLPHAIVHYGRFDITLEELERFKLRRMRQAIGHIKRRVHLWLTDDA